MDYITEIWGCLSIESELTLIMIGIFLGIGIIGIPIRYVLVRRYGNIDELPVILQIFLFGTFVSFLGFATYFIVTTIYDLILCFWFQEC